MFHDFINEFSKNACLFQAANTFVSLMSTFHFGGLAQSHAKTYTGFHRRLVFFRMCHNAEGLKYIYLQLFVIYAIY